jgi:P-type Ca2+ transporter type 2C
MRRPFSLLLCWLTFSVKAATTASSFALRHASGVGVGGGTTAKNARQKSRSSSNSAPSASFSLRGKPLPTALRGGSLVVSATTRATASEAATAIERPVQEAGSRSIQDLFRALNSTHDGMTSVEAEHRLRTLYGPNVLDQPKPKSIWALIAEQFSDRLVQILLAVAVLSAVFSLAQVLSTPDTVTVTPELLAHAFVEPAVILAILVLNAAVGVWQTRSASDSLAALEKLQAGTCTGLRDGRDVTLPSSVLVPGDIIEVRTGDKIPADSRLLSIASSVLSIDEGSLTGESTTVQKLPGTEGQSHPGRPVQDQRGMLYAGTMVTRGSGRAVVTQTGMTTEFGKIQKGVLAAKAEQPKTPLGIKLDEFGETLTVIIGVICVAVWVVSIPKMNDPSFDSVWEGGVYYAKVAVALGVAAIPEGLPAVITLCLSLGTRRMAQRNVIVRNLPSVETLGCTSVICTDKTGTLTTNEVSVMFLLKTCTSDDLFSRRTLTTSVYSILSVHR